MLSGNFIRNIPQNQNNVDLIVIGTVVLPELAQLIRSEEAKRDREINYTVMTEDEYVFRKKRRDPFILNVLQGPRVMIIGDEAELVS
jgi:hypothetical protein